jgi:hypothetical protein
VQRQIEIEAFEVVMSDTAEADGRYWARNRHAAANLDEQTELSKGPSGGSGEAVRVAEVIVFPSIFATILSKQRPE